MTRATFFEHFELLADQPDAVAKIRELVLRLAVHGRLVPQNPKDEPAEKMLARLRALLTAHRHATYLQNHIEHCIALKNPLGKPDPVAIEKECARVPQTAKRFLDALLRAEELCREHYQKTLKPSEK